VQTRDLFIQAIGVHLPPDRITLQAALDAGLCPREDFIGSDLIEVPVANRVTAVDMAVEAARAALKEAGREPTDVDLLVHSTMFRQGPGEWSPVGYLLRELGCGNTAGHEVTQGCNGALAGIEMAAGWLALAATPSTALVSTAAHANQPAVDRWTTAGFGMVLGDGACAVVLGPGRGLARIDTITSITFPELEGLHRGDLPIEELSLQRQKVAVPARAREFAMSSGYNALDMHRIFPQMYTEIAHRALDEAGIGTEDLTRVIFTNAGRSIIETDLMDPLGLPMSMATWDFGRTIGHIGASDHIISLDHLLRTGQVAPGDRVLLVGGTQGYNIAALVLTIGDEPLTPAPEAESR
jgi:3-oxoacyl-[acyl-carrier-protein] synthase III